MGFATLAIELTGNAERLYTVLEAAALVSKVATEKIKKSAEEASQGVTESANAADFSGLSEHAEKAAKSIDSVKAASVGASVSVNDLTADVQKQMDQVSANAKQQSEGISTTTKIAVAASVAAIGYGLFKIGELAASVAFRFVSAGVDIAKFGVGLVTGENLQSKYIDSLIAANDKVKELQVSLGITATSASALGTTLDRIGTSKGDYSSVYTATETAIRKVLQAQDDLQAKVKDARAIDDTDAITAAEKALNDYSNAFDRLGVKYTDEKGNLLDYQTIIQNASKVLDSYTAGYDRNAAAAELGIGSANAVAQAAKVSSEKFTEAAKRQQDYFLVIGPGTQAAVAQYEQAMRVFRNETDLTSQGFKRAIADSTMPILTELSELFKDGFPGAVEVFRGVLTGLVTLFQTFELSAKALYEIVSFVFDGIEIGVTSSMAAANKALHFDFTGAKKEIDEGAKAIEARFDLMNDHLTRNLGQAIAAIDLAAGKDSQRTPLQNEKPGGGRAYTPPLQKPADDKAAAAAPNVDLAKKVLEQQLKVLELYIGEEKSLLASRDEYLQLYYQRDEVSITDYFAIRASQQSEAVADQKKALQEQIAAIEDYIAKTQRDPSLSDPTRQSRIVSAQTDIITKRRELAKVESESADRSIKDWFAQQSATERYRDALKSLESQIARNASDSARAFAIDFEAQNRSATKQYRAVLNSDSSSQSDRSAAKQGLIDLDQLRQQGLASARLNDLDSARSVILGDLANQQARIDLAVTRGQKSELQGLADTSAANASRLEVLSALLEKYEEIAKETGRLSDQVTADGLRVQLEQLRSQTHLVADAFNDAGKDITVNFFDKLGDRTTSLRDKLNSLLNDITNRVLKAGDNVIGNYLFGKDGGVLSGLGNTVASFFKGDAGSTSSAATSAASQALGKVGGAGGTAANDAAFSTLTATVTGADTAISSLSTIALPSLTEAVVAATAALETLAGTSGASSSGESAGIFASLLASANGNIFNAGNVIPFARGGVVNSPTLFPMANGGTGLMGEAGPEAIMPLRRGPGGRLGIAASGDVAQQQQRPVQIVQNFTVQGATDRRSQAQIAAAAASGLSRAASRLN